MMLVFIIGLSGGPTPPENNIRDDRDRKAKKSATSVLQNAVGRS